MYKLASKFEFYQPLHTSLHSLLPLSLLKSSSHIPITFEHGLQKPNTPCSKLQNSPSPHVVESAHHTGKNNGKILIIYQLSKSRLCSLELLTMVLLYINHRYFQFIQMLPEGSLSSLLQPFSWHVHPCTSICSVSLVTLKQPCIGGLGPEGFWAKTQPLAQKGNPAATK